MIYQPDYVLGRIIPSYPLDDAIVARWRQARSAASKSVDKSAWRYSAEADGTPTPGMATDLYLKEAGKLGLQPESVVGAVSSIRLKKVENKFGAHMQLRINLQTRNVEDSMTDRQRMDCYGLFTVDLCCPDTVRLIDGLSGIKRGDTISLDMYAKRKANNGKLVFYKNFSLYKADGQGDWHDMINDERMGPALSRWLDAIGSPQIRNMNAAERGNWLRQETEDDLCKIVHKLPAYRAEYSAKKEKSGEAEAEDRAKSKPKAASSEKAGKSSPGVAASRQPPRQPPRFVRQPQTPQLQQQDEVSAPAEARSVPPVATQPKAHAQPQAQPQARPPSAEHAADLEDDIPF